ncbi:hypothetical protein T484DRAFT_1855049 [Baffinella frigidus]|nr:hypothetical protein T484DRAFT_1855049 [Cryptophyta sp. CCMP2293]
MEATAALKTRKWIENHQRLLTRAASPEIQQSDVSGKRLREDVLLSDEDEAGVSAGEGGRGSQLVKRFRQEAPGNSMRVAVSNVVVAGGFACKTCGMTFTDRSNMNAHEKIHTGVKSHMCTICAKGFYVLSKLTAHMESHKRKDAKKLLNVLHECETCGKDFPKQSQLLAHMESHKRKDAKKLLKTPLLSSAAAVPPPRYVVPALPPTCLIDFLAPPSAVNFLAPPTPRFQRIAPPVPPFNISAPPVPPDDLLVPPRPV